MRRSARALALCGALASAGPAAAAQFDRGDLRIELSGSMRGLYTFTRELDAEKFTAAALAGTPFPTRRDSWRGLARARVELETVWEDRLYGQLIYDVELRTGTTLDSLSFASAERIGIRTWVDADRVFARHRDLHAQHLIYRAWLRYERSGFDLTVGRQRIALGRGRMWNPTDLFNPIFPLAIESGQRVGQDSLVARIELRPGAWAELMWSPQDDWREHRGALRFEKVGTELDLALMFGSMAGDRVLGFDFARNLGDAALRGEAIVMDPGRGGQIWQAVLSLDYTFTVGSGLYALVEHLYNENRVSRLQPTAFSSFPGSAEQLLDAVAATQEPFLDRITTVQRHLTGFQLGYELSANWRANLLWIYDWRGPSAAIFPALSWTVTDDLVVTAGAQFFIGPRERSEYGSATNLAFLQVDAYF